ncbi:MAG: hypothetical protein HY582_00515 [Candidatus Omnitrophica bacterium]|nr:hypothetical protein [Candidatus Omnitrophota bacterium]
MNLINDRLSDFKLEISRKPVFLLIAQVRYKYQLRIPGSKFRKQTFEHPKQISPENLDKMSGNGQVSGMKPHDLVKGTCAATLVVKSAFRLLKIAERAFSLGFQFAKRGIIREALGKR